MLLLSVHCSVADLQDFNNSIITITFEADELEAAAINEIRTPIPIIDDVINEAVEQFFVVQLSLVSSQNPAGVDTSFRSTSLGRIIDNDRKCGVYFCRYLSGFSNLYHSPIASVCIECWQVFFFLYMARGDNPSPLHGHLPLSPFKLYMLHTWQP